MKIQLAARLLHSDTLTIAVRPSTTSELKSMTVIVSFHTDILKNLKEILKSQKSV